MSWFLAFAGFAALIILHEFGHFIAAKWTGMRVERFFLFFPPKLWSIKRGETEYGVGAIPLGGFVKITGMNPDEVEDKPPPEDDRGRGTANDLLARIESAGQKDEDHLPDGRLKPEIRERAYYNQPVWKRIVVIGAGPAMNLLIAFVIFLGLGLTLQEPKGSEVEIADVQKESPAVDRLHVEDRIVSIDGVSATTADFDDRVDRIRELVNAHGCAGEQAEGCKGTTPVRVVVERDGEEVALLITPEYADNPGTEDDRMLLGIGFQPAEFQPAGLSVPEAAEWSADRMWFVTKATVTVFAKIVDPEQRKQLSGVVGSYETTRQAIEFDTRMALGVLGLISLSLAIINLFPFLPLDGGHIFWSLVEKIRGRPVPFAVMERAGVLGFMFVLFIFFIGLSNDIDRLTGEGFDVR